MVETIISLSFLTVVSSVLFSIFCISVIPNTRRETNLGQFKTCLLYFRVLGNLKQAILSCCYSFNDSAPREGQLLSMGP